jgi:hypothetical protein
VEFSIPFVVDSSAHMVGLVTDAITPDTTDQVRLSSDAMSTHVSATINRPNDSTCLDCAKGNELEEPNARRRHCEDEITALSLLEPHKERNPL